MPIHVDMTRPLSLTNRLRAMLASKAKAYLLLCLFLRNLFLRL